MEISASLVKAMAAGFTEAELREKVAATAAEVAAHPTMITSASTGGGSSYARIERISVTDLLELLERALEYKVTGSLDSGAAQCLPVVVLRAE